MIIANMIVGLALLLLAALFPAGVIIQGSMLKKGKKVKHDLRKNTLILQKNGYYALTWL